MKIQKGLIVLLFLFPHLVSAQAQNAGSCSVLQSGSGNTANLRCDNIDATLAKQVRDILKSAKQNQSATKDISAKLDKILKQLDEENARPLVGLKIVYKKMPAVGCVNESDAIARDIRWELVLWNKDTLDLNPLPIPSQACDWLRPRDEGGPFLLARWLDALPGAHLIGTATISCPNCITGRTYVVSIVVGQGGWYSELNLSTPGMLLVPTHLDTEAGRARFPNFLDGLEDLVPPTKRTPIEDMQPYPVVIKP